jgi:hypothetical protein
MCAGPRYPGPMEGLRRALRNPIGWIAFIVVEAFVLLGIVELVPLADRRDVLLGLAAILVVCNYVIRRRFLPQD